MPIEYANVANLLTQVGFPAFAFILMYRMANDSIKENTEAIQELTVHLKSLDGGET